MREILLRGKRKDNGQWVEGFLIIRKIWSQTIYVIREEDNGFDTYVEYEVIPETVGEYVGFHDNNSKKIFEGDIVKISVLYDVGCYPHSETEKRIVKIPAIYYSNYGDYEVIGNIHDNSDLLKDDGDLFVTKINSRDFGVNTFLTKEEAEAALEKVKGE